MTAKRMTPAAVGDPIPAVCTVRDVCQHLGISRATFERKYAAGELPLVRVEIGRVTPRSWRRFTGDSVRAITRGRWARPAFKVSA